MLYKIYLTLVLFCLYINFYGQSFYLFPYGVASGDATDSSVEIWTKIVPKNKDNTIVVKWQISKDSSFKKKLEGKAIALKTKKYSVKFLVSGLDANSIYYYRFYTLRQYSPVGKTKTLPSKSQKIKKFEAVFFTGSNYSAGFFNAYAAVNKMKNIDAIFHLGDYIYEYGNNSYPRKKVRKVKPDKECITYEDYNKRYETYRLDTNLMYCHANYCWYMMWDDHEFADNSWKGGAVNQQKNEGNWDTRENNALKAYLEWLPVSFNSKNNAYRSFNVGNLAKFILLDTRITGRDKQTDKNDSTKSLLGNYQRKWLYSQLLQAKADSVKWIFIMSQVMFAPLRLGGKVMNNDQWDGYEYERKKLLDFIDANKLTNIVIISGDIHSSWANLVKTPGGIAVPEFITPSITSPSVGRITGKISNVAIKFFWKDVKYINLWRRGFMQMTITPDTLFFKWYYLKTIKKTDATIKKTVRRKYAEGKIFK